MKEHIIDFDADTAKDQHKLYVDSVKKHRAKREEERKARAHKIHQDLHKVRVEKTRMEKEDEMLKGAYLELSRYNSVINIHTAISRTGLNDQRLPKLAICRADAERCFIRTDRRNGAEVLRFGMGRSWHLATNDTVVNVNVPHEMYNTLSDWGWRDKNKFPYIDRVSARVPIVPPEHRPADLENYFILWEAVWDGKSPIDPFLLRKVNDQFYVVVAQWDLTELERTLLEARPT
jgi:hypothetical protein